MPAIAVSEIHHPPARTPLLEEMTVLSQFVQFVSEDALQEHIPVSKIETRDSVDPEDDTHQVLVRLWIRGLPQSEIRRYYQDLGERIDRWAVDLPEAQRLDLFAHISFQARRDADDGTL